MNLAVLAALIAAGAAILASGVSLAGVLITVRRSDRRDRLAWQREHVKPVVLDLLTRGEHLTNELVGWHRGDETGTRALFDSGGAIRDISIHLELIATPRVADAAEKLATRLENSVAIALSEPGDPPIGDWQHEMHYAFRELRKTLIDAMRDDLGLPQ
jgi:hypothetical protein